MRSLRVGFAHYQISSRRDRVPEDFDHIMESSCFIFDLMFEWYDGILRKQATSFMYRFTTIRNKCYRCIYSNVRIAGFIVQHVTKVYKHE